MLEKHHVYSRSNNFFLILVPFLTSPTGLCPETLEQKCLRTSAKSRRFVHKHIEQSKGILLRTITPV